MKFYVFFGFVVQVLFVLVGIILWDGCFNDMILFVDLNKWFWGNQVGLYQYYIYGFFFVLVYVNFLFDYKNLVDIGFRQGVKIMFDNMVYWNGQNMCCIELIFQIIVVIN